jgi:type II secretory pathway pseudopilin PulG
MRGQRGGLLVETVVAIMVFTAVGSAVLTGLSISQTTGGDIERRAVAEELARTQMEYLASQPYQDPPVVYGIAPTVVLPPGYAMLIVGAEEYPGDQNLQRITVTVSAGAENVLTLETFRTRVN